MTKSKKRTSARSKGNVQRATKSGLKKKSKSARKVQATGRSSTDEKIKWIVRIRAAGHCEQCGVDLTQDPRIGRANFWSEVAHILPASPRGPRAEAQHDRKRAKVATNDPDNLLLLCPGCHTKIDKDAAGYPTQDLLPHHLQHIAQIRYAASVGETSRGIGLIFLSQHFSTRNIIRKRDLADAMFAEKLWAVEDPISYALRAPGLRGRDEAYWKLVEEDIEERLSARLDRLSSQHGDPLTLAVVGLADIPSLVRLGRKLGDRSNRIVYSYDRTSKLRWVDKDAKPPAFIYTPPPDGDGPVALVISLSARIRSDDVVGALSGCRIAEFSTPNPSYGLIKNRDCIHAFRDALQPRLSALESSTADPIHVFSAIPAAMALEFGALLSTQHAHRYVLYDRGAENRFERAMELGPRTLIQV